MSYSRILLIIASLALLLGVVVAGRWKRPAPDVAASPAARVWTNEACKECHAEAWQEWQESYHSRSFTDPQVTAAFRHFGHDRQCESCHAPQPVLAVGLEQPVALRAEGRDTGVDCLSCHLRADGRIAGSDTLSQAPCSPVATPALLDSRHCGACHTAIFRDWQASRYAATQDCVGCHMPVDKESGRHDHTCIGGHDLAYVRSGATMSHRIEDGHLLVDVTNHRTGHNFPGERHNRVLTLEVLEREADGDITLARQEIIKDVTPFRGESSAERLQVDETFTARFPIVAGSRTATLQLLYKPFAWQPDHEALIVHEAELELPPP